MGDALRVACLSLLRHVGHAKHTTLPASTESHAAKVDQIKLETLCVISIDIYIFLYILSRRLFEKHPLKLCHLEPAGPGKASLGS